MPLLYSAQLPYFMEASMGGSRVSVLDLLSSSNDVKRTGSPKLTSGGVAVLAGFCAIADFVLDKFSSSEPTMSSLMISWSRLITLLLL